VLRYLRKPLAASIIKSFLGLWLAAGIVANLSTSINRTVSSETDYAARLHLFEGLAAHREAIGSIPRSVSVVRGSPDGTLSLIHLPSSYMAARQGLYGSSSASDKCLAVFEAASLDALPEPKILTVLLGMSGRAMLLGNPVLLQGYAIYAYRTSDGSCPESLLNPWEFSDDDLQVVDRFDELSAAGSVPIDDGSARRFAVRLDDRLPLVGVVGLHVTDGRLNGSFRSRVLRALLSHGIGNNDRWLRLHRPRLVVSLSDGRRETLHFAGEILDASHLTFWPSISSETLDLRGSVPVSAVFESDGPEIFHTHRFGAGLSYPEDRDLLWQVSTGPIRISLFGETTG